MQLDCKVIKKWQPPFLAKFLVLPPQETKFLEGLPPPPAFCKGAGALTMVVQNMQSCDKPIDFCYLLYSPYLWNLIVENTNKCGKSVPTKKSKGVKVKIMKGFMAAAFNMGLIRKNEFTDYWSTRQSMITSERFCVPFTLLMIV